MEVQEILKPLTLEELTQMTGQPSYCVTDCSEKWVLINCIKNGRISWRTLSSAMSNCDIRHLGKRIFFYKNRPNRDGDGTDKVKEIEK